jgi:hypothetical protein
LQGKASHGEKFEKVLSNAEAIQNTCKFMVAEASERIFKLEENTWAVYYTETINTNQVCQAKNMIKTCQINSGDTVTVEPGCYIRTMDHMISANESKSRSRPWTGLDNWQNSLVGPTLRASTLPFMASGQSTTESLTKVNCLKELHQIRPAEMHLTFTSPAAMIGFALVIFQIGMLIWKKCFSKPNTVESNLPAQSAAPMPASGQPQRHIETPVTNNQANKSNASNPIHINISLRNSPKKGRDIGTKFEKTSTSLI